MIKQCLQCNSDFEENTHTGQEQKYCSASCRYRAANSRRENKIKQEAINSINNENTKHQASDLRQNDDGRNQVNSSTLRIKEGLGVTPTFREYDINPNENFNSTRNFATQENNGVSANYIGVLEKYFDTRSDNKYLVSELMRVKEKNIELEKELDERDAQDEEDEDAAELEEQTPQNNLGNSEEILRMLIKVFSEDPAGMTNMTKTLVPEIIGGVVGFFKPKTA